MPSLDTSDVAQLLRLLAEAGDPLSPMSIPDRKLFLLRGLAQIISAEIYSWNIGVSNRPENPNDAMSTQMVDGGWASEEEKVRFLGFIVDPERLMLLQGGLFESFQRQRTVTLHAHEIVDQTRREEALEIYSGLNFSDSLVGIYPINEAAYSAFGFHRRNPRPPFGDRERMIVQLVLEQVDWLHRYAMNIPAGDRSLSLTGRQRQVLVLLLAGDGRKQIAAKLKISLHTVGDHVKQIYRCYNVGSSGELFAHFASGGKAK